jgi:integrase
VSTLAPTLQAYITERLIRQRQASSNTVAAYRDSFKLLLVFAQRRTGKPPSKLEVADLDAPLIGAFLDHLESERGNSIRTRNARLAAIHSLFRYAALRHPEDAAVIQRVLAMPPKRFESAIVTYFTEDEIDALIAATEQGTWTARTRQGDTGPRLSNRPASKRTHRLDGRRCPPRNRCAHQLPGQRPQTADHTDYHQHRKTARSLDGRACWPTRRSALPHSARHPAKP